MWLFCTVGFNEIGMQTFFYQTEMMTSGMALNLFKNLKFIREITRYILGLKKLETGFNLFYELLKKK